MPKGMEKFATKPGQSKSPRQKKSPNHISLPKKKAKLRLEPLGPRNATRPFATADPTTDNAAVVQDGDIPKSSAVERRSYRGPMRTLDSKVRARNIYLSHLKQKMNQERGSAKRLNSKRIVAMVDGALKPRNRIEIAGSLRGSRQQLSKLETPTPRDGQQEEMVQMEESQMPNEVQQPSTDLTN
eukprot:CAMPEP_0185606718 /NCGR_PEP_ID=MMETSP0436-20130131/4972_1 /TAXON_ID=626734 ORGANISM="Favella taraikaensis, Strain Fe Narragansett Bay" /NCGR_SAMPLE_ID=MMETSP0436 /ASSEMBLY_ACC=CAM_ASM_000390 /LENGTH=183 /DNA_ID=CAMNT_0028238369 /DNA_START=1522 /DNA_END=2076 /DNA_ORIENTATION=-